MEKGKLIVVEGACDGIGKSTQFELLNKRFSEEGYEVYSANNGIEALEEFSKRTYDAILLDVMMPKLDGWSVLRQIRQEDKDIPIIMVTARSQLEDKAIGEETGVNEYITKPFELDAIVKKVEEYLK